MVEPAMKRGVLGKFALKNSGYRQVRSLRLTDATWLTLGTAAECLGMTRADYLEQMVRDDTLPGITGEEANNSPCITRKKDCPELDNADVKKETAIALPQFAELEALRDRVLFDLKLGKQAPGYKAAHKALNRFITELSSSA